MVKKKKIGIIGGMGPMATVDLFYRIIKFTRAYSDLQHIHIIIDNNTSIPDRTNYILGSGPNPVLELIKSARFLENSGANFLLMPCNTAHFFYEYIQKSISIPLLNMIEITAKYCKSQNLSRVGLLSTAGTLKTRIYHDALIKEGITCETPNDEENDITMKYIYQYKSGILNNDINPLLTIINNIIDKGANRIILGCTELPIICRCIKTDVPLINPVQLLALTAIELAGARTINKTDRIVNAII